MYNPVAVCGLQSHGNLNGNAGSFLYRESALLGNIFLQCDSLDQFHNNVINSIVISNIKYINNIWMCQNCGSLCLTSEFLYKSCIFPKLRLQHLDSDKTIQLVILCLVYVRHSAGTYFA